MLDRHWFLRGRIHLGVVVVAAFDFVSLALLNLRTFEAALFLLPTECCCLNAPVPPCDQRVEGCAVKSWALRDPGVSLDECWKSLFIMD
ncbi:hypothetical protein DL96DRAFT_240640 [Flagelloscypha sp. PMI_526]|nr:hypothetical protein DL96DRAFT_240640 [Flagelloscypha sp. PMI_526]